MPPRRGCRLAVANEAFFHNAQFVIIRPMPAAFTIGCGKYFDLSTIDKVGHKLGLTIGLSLRSDGHRRRFTKFAQVGWFSTAACANDKPT